MKDKKAAVEAMYQLQIKITDLRLAIQEAKMKKAKNLQELEKQLQILLSPIT